MLESSKYSSFHDYLDSLMQNKESDHVEFKRGKGGFPSDFWLTYSAFSNSDGGVIILGVREKNNNFYPEGLSKEKVDEYEKIFWDLVNNPQKINRKHITNEDVIKERYQDNYFLIVFVPRAKREERPIYIGQNPLTGTYRRNATGDYPCSEREVSIMLSERQPDFAQDYEIMEGFTFENDVDPESWRAFRQLFSTLKSTHVWADADDLSLLKHLKGYRKDRKSGKEGLTLSGLLMFGKIDSITDALPHYMIDYREYEPGGERWSNRIYNDGSWEANLFQAYRRILPKLQSFLPTPFKLNGNTRIDETNAHKSLREAFVNFCVHASFQSDSKLTIRKYPNEIIFSNPGTMLVSKEQFYEGSESVCRNPSLQTMFSFIGAAEKAGSGSDTIITGWKEANYRLPVITEKARPNKVELIMSLESILSNDIKRKLEVIFGKNIFSLETNKLKILAATISSENVSNSLLQHIIDLHPADITDLLKTLCKDEYLIANGIGRGTTYTINYNRGKFENEENPQPLAVTKDEREFGGLFALEYATSNSTSNATSNGTSNSTSNATSNATSKDAISFNSARYVTKNAASNTPSNTPSNAPSNTTQRLSYIKLCNLVVQVSSAWKNAHEIARSVLRSSDHIRSNILPRMVKDGYLEMLDKENPKSPLQKYRATKKGKQLL